MFLGNQSGILLISRDPALIAAFEPLLRDSGARITISFSPTSALAILAAPQPPSLVLYDAEAAHLDGESSFCQWLHEVRTASNGHRIPVVLISDSAREDWTTCLNDGSLDDLIPRSIDSAFWRLRISIVLRDFHRMRELDRLRESTAIDAQMDRLTGIYNRNSMLSALFRETDRVQRMKTALSLILFDLDDFGNLNAKLGCQTCDDVLCQIVGRAMRLLRSYDLFGRTGSDQFLLILPGCGTADAHMLCERIQTEVFGKPFTMNRESVSISACFGIAQSRGRSPIVVLRAAEEALADAKDAGYSIIKGADNRNIDNPTADFLSCGNSEEILTW
ncbi:MAG: diguanylate cyclase [Acidobacteriota bacterium]|nr:diguanylate cyclase [Acidobacteriota bacterium]